MAHDASVRDLGGVSKSTGPWAYHPRHPLMTHEENVQGSIDIDTCLHNTQGRWHMREGPRRVLFDGTSRKTKSCKPIAVAGRR